MNFEPKISIIMNCYNGEEFLQTALQSVLFQTYTNWELIFWDNVSTDNSSHIFNLVAHFLISDSCGNEFRFHLC